MARYLIVSVVAASLIALAQTPAAAQSGADKAAAEKLFNDARKLMKKGNYSEACPKLDASLKLDPALGTRLNLAKCYEEVGKLASAWGLYREAEDLAKQNKDNRARFARSRAKALEPRLPQLVIKAPSEDEIPGLTVTRDGTTIDRAIFDTATYVDPGELTIEAKAPGYKPFSTTVTAVEREETTVEIPTLEPAPRADPDTPTEPTGSPGTGDLPGANNLTDTGPSQGNAGTTRRLIGLGAAGAGVVALGVGVGFGLSAKSKWDGAFDDGLCDSETNVCTPEGQSQTDSARSRATIATVAAGAGLALVAAGAVIYFTAPSGKESQVARVIPSAGQDSVGLVVVGSF